MIDKNSLRIENLVQTSREAAGMTAKVVWLGALGAVGVGCKVTGLGDDMLHMLHRTPPEPTFPDHPRALPEAPAETIDVMHLNRDEA